MTHNIIMPLPSQDFDPTEVAITWQGLVDNGFKVTFATVNGERAHCDPMMISGEGLEPWGWIPGLKKIRFIGLILRASASSRAAYKKMQKDSEFLNPKTFTNLNVIDYQGMALPGGHASGMRPYLENKTLQRFVADFFETLDANGKHKPIAAVCHGVVLAARSISNKTGQSILFGKKTTALTWKLEKSAWDLTKFYARFWDNTYYRTYSENKGEPAGHWSVQSEVTRALKNTADFVDVDKSASQYFTKSSGMFRDSLDDDKAAWVVVDGNYVSARWPGDVHTMTKKFMGLFN